MSEYIKKDFTCAAERHLWRSGLALAIYGKLYALTLGNGGHYFSSKERFMEYLAASRDRVDKAFKLLEKEGWIEREYVNPENTYEIRKKEFRSKDYRVFSHNEWNEKHPDKCCVKEPMPWDGEEQYKLCQDLWKFSKGKLKWYANQLAALRSFSTGELTLVDWLGTGAMLVQRSVFEKLAAAHPEWQTRNPSAEKLPGADKPYFHFFHIGINSETNNMLSEDLFFYQAARKLGIEIFVVPNAVTSHIGSFSYLMNLPAVASLNPVLEQPAKEAA